MPAAEEMAAEIRAELRDLDCCMQGRWASKRCFWEKPVLQTTQKKGRSPAWILRWLLRWEDWAKRLWQIVQGYGFSPAKIYYILKKKIENRDDC